MGGLGKSTVALAVAATARAAGWRVWWVTATDAASLTGGMLEVLQQLGAPEAVTRPVREGARTAAERAWEFLNSAHEVGRRWLLIFDNADTPAVLAAHSSTCPADHAGWLRPDPAGMILVTSRVKDPHARGPGVALRELQPLDDATAARVLADLAPGIADPGSEQARELGRRLGGLPLALHLAGSHLASLFARWDTFAAYRDAIDSTALPAALAELDDPRARARANLAWMIELQGRHAEAERLLGQVLADREQILGDAHPDAQTTRFALAETMVGQGRHSEAEDLLERVLANRERVLGDEHPDTAKARNALARISAMQRKPAR